MKNKKMEDIIERRNNVWFQNILSPSKKKDLICYMLIITSLMISIFFEPFAWVALGLVFVSALYFRDIQKIINLLLFTLGVNVLFRISHGHNDLYYDANQLIRFVLILTMLGVYIFDLVKKKKKLNWKLFIPIILYLIYISIPIHATHVYLTIRYFLLYTLMYLVYEYRDKLNLKSIVLHYAGGMILGALLTIFINCSQRLENIIYYDIVNNCWRFTGMFDNSNGFAVHASVVANALLFLLYNHKISKIQFFVTFIPLFITGYMTLSRLFVVAMFIGLFVFVLLYLIKKRRKSIKTIGALTLSVLLIIGCCFIHTKVYLARFGILDATKVEFSSFKPKHINAEKKDNYARPDSLEDQKEWWDKVYNGEIRYDPGREIIREQYWDDTTSSLKVILFGRGAATPYIGKMHAHNMLLMEFWLYGIVGLLFYVTFILCAINFKKIKNWKKIFPWFIMILPYASIAIVESSTFSYYPFIVFLLGIVELMRDKKIFIAENVAYKQDDKLSIVVAAYNVEKYIGKCLDSILNQTYKNIEVVIVDDGSTDETLKICNEYIKKDGRIKVIHQKNQGVSAARNNGISKTTGKYIAFVDADDFVHESMYEKLMHSLKTNKSDIALCGYQYAYENNAEAVPVKEINLTKLENEQIYEYLFKVGQSFEDDAIITENIIGCIWRAVYNKEVLNGVKFEAMPICEDMVFMIDLFNKKPKVSIVDEPLYYYLQRSSSVVHAYDDKKIKNKILAYDIISKKIKTLVKEETLKAYQFHTYASVINELLKNSSINEISEILKLDNFSKLNTLENYKLACKNTQSLKYKVAYWFIYHKYFKFYKLILRVIQ